MIDASISCDQDPFLRHKFYKKQAGGRPTMVAQLMKAANDYITSKRTASTVPRPMPIPDTQEPVDGEGSRGWNKNHN